MKKAIKKASAKIILRSNHTNKDLTKGVYIKFITNRKTHLISLGIFTHADHWDATRCRLKSSAYKYIDNNEVIDTHETRAKQIIRDYRINGKSLSFQQFRRHVLDSYYNSQSFFDYCEKQTKLKGPSLAKGTYNNYNFQLNKLRSFRKDVTFDEIDNTFIREYENHLITTKKNNKNTVIKAKVFIKTMLNEAKKEGIITSHIFDTVPITRITGNRSFLDLEEIAALQTLFDKKELPTNKNNVLRYFLFACYTGLRYQDMKDLAWKHIQESTWINIVMHKTREAVRIPIIEAARKLLPIDPGNIPNLKVFKVLTDQPTNRYLKDIASHAGINKRISFHSARHSFATLALDSGIGIETVSKILGHTEIKTTQIYARIRDGKKAEEMKKIDFAFKTVNKMV